MRVLISGAAGFLGRMLATRLVADGALGGTAITGMTLLDVVDPSIDAPFPVETFIGDMAEAPLDVPHDVVVHLAAVVSSEAEADLDKGLRVNLDGTRLILDAARHWGNAPRFFFASSVAVFSCLDNERITDMTEPRPRSSYGAQKLMGEILVRDYTRRGLVEGVSLRLPTISVRPGKPNKAASSFASSILREPLNGEEAVLPVREGISLHLMSPEAAVEAMLHALTLPAAELCAEPSVTLPGVSVTVAEMLAELERVAGPAARALVTSQRDAAIEALVETWPGGIDAPRAEALGFHADPDFATLLARSKPHL